MIPIENRIYKSNFFGAGNPNEQKIVANTGVQFTDVEKRIRYKQITIPYGKIWEIVATEVTVTIPAGTSADDDGLAMAVTFGGIL